MKLITLTDNEGHRVLINPIMITTLQEVRPSPSELQVHAKVYTMAGDRRHVRETIEEILELIKKSETTHNVSWLTGTKSDI